MIVLDTNVVSELLRPSPDPTVVRWVEALDPGKPVAVTTITAAELLTGVEIMDDGTRKENLREKVTAVLSHYADAGVVLPFDEHCASHYARIVATRRAAGRPVPVADAMIAATCAHHRATLATRNVMDFAGTGIDLENPWIA